MSINKIKVLMIDSWVGEGNEYALYICKELKKAGIDISLIVPEDNIDKEVLLIFLSFLFVQQKQKI